VAKRLITLHSSTNVMTGIYKGGLKFLMVRVAGFGSVGPEFKSHSAVELIPGGVNSA